MTRGLAITLNALSLYALAGVLAAAFAAQLWLHELPGPLCLLQRVQFAMLAIGPILNIRFGPRPAIMPYRCCRPRSAPSPRSGRSCCTSCPAAATAKRGAAPPRREGVQKRQAHASTRLRQGFAGRRRRRSQRWHRPERQRDQEST